MPTCDVYQTWVSWASGTSATTTDTSYVWRVWAGDSHASDNVTTDSTWTTWASGTADNGTYVSTHDVWLQWVQIPLTQTYQAPHIAPAKPLSIKDLAEAQAKLKAELARQEQEHKEAMKREKESAERAMKLLKEFLDEHQRTLLEKHKYVDILGSRGKTTYRIELGGRVYELADQTTKVASFCIHSRDMCYPDGDEVLAKILMLQTDEDRFLKTANKTVIQPAAR